MYLFSHIHRGLTDSTNLSKKSGLLSSFYLCANKIRKVSRVTNYIKNNWSFFPTNTRNRGQCRSPLLEQKFMVIHYSLGNEQCPLQNYRGGGGVCAVFLYGLCVILAHSVAAIESCRTHFYLSSISFFS